jgi:hypothetical protein
MSKFTPGPLFVKQNENWPWSYLIEKPNGDAIEEYGLYIYSTSDTRESANARLENEECRANVYLRAAAPDMYEALKAYVGLENEVDECDCALCRAVRLGRAALAKADGK